MIGATAFEFFCIWSRRLPSEEQIDMIAYTSASNTLFLYMVIAGFAWLCEQLQPGLSLQFSGNFFVRFVGILYAAAVIFNRLLYPVFTRFRPRS